MEDKIKINQQNKIKNKPKRKQQAKSTSGITLIVLVITIVIMIILASVSVSLFTSGDGMYNNADTAVIEYKTKSIIEVIRAADMYLEQNNRFDRTKKKDIVELVEKIAEISEINEKNKDYIIDVRPEEQSATIIDKKTGVAVDILIDERDRVIIETSVIENIKDITVPKVEHTINPQEPEKATVVTITIKATEENKGIAKIKFPDGTEKAYSNEKTVTEPYEVTKNDIYRFIVVGANGRQAIETVKITNVKEAVVAEIQIARDKSNNEPTKDKVNMTITYDGAPEFNGKELTNADRYQYKIGEGSWQTATNPQPVPVTTNVTVYARYYDGRTGYLSKSDTVNNIDNLPPKDFDLQVTATENTITVSAVGTVEDEWTSGCALNNRGIAGYQYQLLNEDGATVLKDWTPAYPYHENPIYTFSQEQDEVEIKAGTAYRVNMRAVDKAGNPTEATNGETTVVETESTADPLSLIGAYVNYDAGSWTEEDFALITSSTGSPTVNKSTALPNTQGQFGGYTVGQSRNTSSKQWSYTKSDVTYENPRTNGWRIWDIADKGDITLISAGNPETYYHKSGYDAESRKILKNRNCTMYENSYAKLGSAKILIGTEALRWYNKIYGTYYTWGASYVDADNFFRDIKFTTSRPIDMLENGSIFWCVGENDNTYLTGVDPAFRKLNTSNSMSTNRAGIRVLVTLDANVRLDTRDGTGTVDNPYELIKN